jgi:tRNA G18 (ribose-2'-O)-methylase SpoU
MPAVRLTDLDDPRVADYRHVSDAELVRRRGLFVAEGRLVVERLIERGGYVLRSVLVSDAAQRQLERVLSTIDVPVYVCDPEAFLRLTGYNIHRGCLALAERPAPRPLSGLLAAARRVLVLEAIANADNVGGAFRNAAAFGADAVVLSPTCCDPLYRKAIRTSMAATLRVPFARADDWPSALGALRAHGFTIAALTPRAPSEDLAAFAARPRPERLAIVAGTEGAGLSEETEAVADVRVRIPIARDVDSLNVSVAIGIALYGLFG